ncbi:WD repeat-containing protein 18 [Prorops nasuta]|uniref:WD repeat-containing protein 18 n=1 Tax=Prorops nasuta TaxID=863751 RepID=UPI0034CD0D23
MSRTSKEVIITSDSSGQNWNAAVYSPNTGSLLMNYKGGGALTYHTLQLLNDSYILGADLTKNRLHVWPLNSQNPLASPRLITPGKVTALVCTPSGAYIVAAVSEKLFIWQTSTGRLLITLTRHYQTVTCLSVSSDGTVFASGAEDGLVFVWSLFHVLNDEAPSPVHGFTDHVLPVKDVLLGHFGARCRLCSASLDRTINIYEAMLGQLLLKLVFDVPLTSVCMNIKESDLFAGCANGNVFRFNLHEPPRGLEHHVRIDNQKSDNAAESNAFLGHTSSVVCLSASTDCQTLLTASSDGKVNIWDIASRQVLRTIEHKGSITSAFFAKYYDNFQAAELSPSLILHSLQRTSEQSDNESPIEIIRGSNASSDFLNFDSYVDNNIGSKQVSDQSEKIAEMREELERLKKINADLYKFSAKIILGQAKSSQRE